MGEAICLMPNWSGWDKCKVKALFWRGWAHQQLVQYWGEGYPCNGDGEKLGIPLRLEASMTPSTLRAKRNTVNEVYNQIWEDYKAGF
ncbi:RagB/SusD family nutrient uptake outer membrane protein [Bacteroides salyersiae]|nr:RagB/SusD family nutrient uptake outer membrane protein [Bacteroides salyersiae]